MIYLLIFLIAFAWCMFINGIGDGRGWGSGRIFLWSLVGCIVIAVLL